MTIKISGADILLRGAKLHDLQLSSPSEDIQSLILKVTRPDWRRAELVKRFLFPYYNIPGTVSLIKLTYVLGFSKIKNSDLAIHGNNEIYSVRKSNSGVDIETYNEIIHIPTSYKSKVVVDDVRITQEILLRVRSSKRMREMGDLSSFIT